MPQGFPVDAYWRPTQGEVIAFYAVIGSVLSGLLVGLVITWVKRPKLWIWGVSQFVVPIAFYLVTQNMRRTFEMVPNLAGAWMALFALNYAGLWVTQGRSRDPNIGLKMCGVHGALFGGVLFICGGGVQLGHREAPRFQCKNNLKQLGVGAAAFEEEHQQLPGSQNGESAVSWRVELLKYIDFESLGAGYDRSTTWESDSNTEVARREVVPFFCPGRGWSDRPTDAKRRHFTDYVTLTGDEAIAPVGKTTHLRDVTDGASNTLQFVEASGLPVVWTEPRDFDLSLDPIGVNLLGDKPDASPGMISAYHPNGGNVALADGSVRFVNERIDPSVLKKLATKAGGEDVDPEWDQR